MTKPLILVTNDDGVHSPGILTLAGALEELGEVFVYAPDREQSAVGHGVSLHRPLRVREVGERRHSVDGTPTDCVMLAVRALLPRRPAIVFSGINTGPNLGDDVTYSGTVAGAYEGMLLGVPSIAISNASYDSSNFDTAAHFAVKIGKAVLDQGLPPDTVLNVNVPESAIEDIRGIAITKQGLREYEDEIIRRVDPRGLEYFWIGGLRPEHVVHPGTDFEAVAENKVSITPLHRDLTNYGAIEALRQRNFGG
jgi:5'-nucleotidase